MDGHQQARRPDFSSTFQPASVLDGPGAAKPNGGVARAIALAKKLTFGGLALGGVLYFGDAVLPEHLKPSTLLGGFHGRVETAEIQAKREANIAYQRELANAQTEPTINWQMEAEAFRQQQEAIAKSLATREAAAEIADAACLGAPLVTLFMGDTREAREIKATMQAGCAEAARIRAEMTRIQAEAARQGSALMQRYRPGASPLTEPIRR